LAAVRGAFNAVFVETQLAGPLMFYGQGAGGVATSSAVLGDFVTVARHRVLGGKAVGESAYAALPVLEPGAAVTRYQIRMVVDDQPGVLSQVAGVLAAHHISIEKVSQTPILDSSRDDAGAATLVITTHAATEREFGEVRAELAASPHVLEIVSVLRVESGGYYG
jgi:homoserine dehydrogenase